MSASPAISVIIPTLNEADELPATLRHARALDGLREIIVVDAGSTDGTRDLAHAAGCHVLKSAPSRGRQLRLGAEAATGDLLVFLHADTWLPPCADVHIRTLMDRPDISAGAFYKRFRDHGALPGSRVRCWMLWALANRFFGDQTIFVRRRQLEALGGIPAVPLMEDYALCERMAQVGRLALAPGTVHTSARKFREEGMGATYARMIRCSVQYWGGASPESLQAIYSPRLSA